MFTVSTTKFGYTSWNASAIKYTVRSEVSAMRRSGSLQKIMRTFFSVPSSSFSSFMKALSFFIASVSV